MSATSLPRLVRWLITKSAPDDNRDFLLDDLGEEYSERREMRGRTRAMAWLLSQTVRSLGPLAATRLHERRAVLADTPQGDPMFTQLRDDLRYSLRVAVRRPWLSLTVVATMVLGIGATTAVFSMIDAVLLRPLAFPASEQLVRLSSTLKNAAYPAMVVNHADISDLERETSAFASIALFDMTSVINETAPEPERISAVLAGPAFAETLRLRPTLGRLFSADEYLSTGPSAVMLTHEYWVSHFNSDNGVVGRSIIVSGRPRRIVAVLPVTESQYPPGAFDVWIPLVIPPDSYLRGRLAMQLNGIARLRRGVTIEAANAELLALSRRLIAEHPETNADRILQATPLRDTIVGPVRPMLILLGAAVAAVLIIACANLGSLLLAHSQSRVREFAVRAAIGGAGKRIARQLLVENLVLAFIGGAAGLWFARFLVRGLIAVYPTRLPRAEEISLDWRVMLIALGATVAAGVLAGMPLARQVRRLDLARDLRDGERGLGSRARRRVLDGIVVGQMATSVALLFAAAVLLRTFVDMTSIRPGFDATNVLTFSVAPSPVRYGTPERQSALYNALLDSLRAIPSVRSAAWAMFPPLSAGGWGDSFIRQGMSDTPPNLPFLQLKMVSPDYASTLHIPMLAGRAFSPGDRGGAPNVGIVNAALAAKYYPGTSPVGKHITFEERSVEIVGVLDDVRSQSLWAPATPELYVPIEQWGWRGGTIVVRTSGKPRGIEPQVRAAVRALDPLMPVLGVGTLEERVKRSTAPERFRAILVGTLATLALLLSLLGIYGLVAWAVGRSTREIGIRMALGEASARVRLRVIGRAVRLGAIGVSLGALLALGLARWLQAFAAGEISARDPVTLVTTMAIFLVATAVAAWIPARRASRIDPLLAIRAE